MLDRASSHRWKLEAHLNPSDLSKVWVNLDGVKCFDLKSADPDMLQVTSNTNLNVSRQMKPTSLGCLPTVFAGRSRSAVLLLQAPCRNG